MLSPISRTKEDQPVRTDKANAPEDVGITLAEGQVQTSYNNTIPFLIPDIQSIKIGIDPNIDAAAKYQVGLSVNGHVLRFLELISDHSNPQIRKKFTNSVLSQLIMLFNVYIRPAYKENTCLYCCNRLQG